MPLEVDYYQVLNLTAEAGSEEIHRAYRTLARRHHPDLSPGTEPDVRMAIINEAYECLSHPERRRDYDRNRVGLEPNDLRRAVLDAAEEVIVAPGWRRTSIGPGDAIFEHDSIQVFTRLVAATAGADEVRSWIQAARRSVRRGLAESTVLVAYRISANSTVVIDCAGKTPATAIDLVEGRVIGRPFADPRIAGLFSPLLIE